MEVRKHPKKMKLIEYSITLWYLKTIKHHKTNYLEVQNKNIYVYNFLVRLSLYT